MKSIIEFGWCVCRSSNGRLADHASAAYTVSVTCPHGNATRACGYMDPRLSDVSYLSGEAVHQVPVTNRHGRSL